MSTSTVSRQVTFQVLDAEVAYRPVPSVWCYDADNPYAVKVVFPGQMDSDGEPLSWVMARDLLAAGLRQAAGGGDITLWPARGRVCMNLSSPDGKVLLAADADRVRSFLSATYRVVKPGREWVDVDSWVDKLLEEAQS